MIISGIVMLILGVPMFLMGFGGATAQLARQKGVGAFALDLTTLSIMLILGGLVLLGFAVFSGLAIGSLERMGRRRVDFNAKVLARYGTNHRGELGLGEWQFDEPGMRFFVRLLTSDGKTAEYECARPVFDQCGEGMVGEAHFQGHWLGHFRPYIGGVPPPVP